MYSLNLKSNIVTASVMVSALLLSGAALASAENGDEDLPEARELLDRHFEAMGGREAVEKQENSTMKGRFEMPASGLVGSIVVASRPTNDRVSIIELEGFGEIRSGYSSELAWSVDPFTGPRLLEGEELQAQAEQNETGAMLREDSHVDSMETVERTEMDGQECYRVRVEWKSGRESFDCYATDSGLMLAIEMTQPSPMGEMSSVSLFQDYQEFDGIQVPTRTLIRSMGQEQVLIIESIDLGEPDEALFELPASIQALAADNASE